MIGFDSKRLSRWLAPLVGAVIVPVFVIRMFARQPGAIANEHLPLALTIGAIVGFSIGLLVLVLDPAPEADEPDSGLEQTPPTGSRGTLISRFLAVASVTLFFTGPVALFLAVAAIVFNRRVSGWPRIASWTGLILSILATILFVLAIVLS